MPHLTPYLSRDRLVAEHLRRAPLFAELPSEHRDCLLLLREGAFFDVPAAVAIVSPGDPPALFVIIEGSLHNADGEVAWQAGDCLGIVETLAGQPFASAIRTSRPSLLYRLDAALMEAFRARCPLTAQRLLDEMAVTVRAASSGPCVGAADASAAPPTVLDEQPASANDRVPEGATVCEQ